jgi:hypothetical protein
MAGTLSVQTIQGLATAPDPTTVSIASGHILHAPGHVIQVVQTIDDSIDSYSGAANSFLNYTGLDTTITPVASDSKFLIQFDIKLGAYQYSRRVVLDIDGTYHFVNANGGATFAGSTMSGYISATGSLSDASYFSHHGRYLYAHSGSASFSVGFDIYKQDANVIYVNRAYSYADAARGYAASELTVMEIAQ